MYTDIGATARFGCSWSAIHAKVRQSVAHSRFTQKTRDCDRKIRFHCLIAESLTVMQRSSTGCWTCKLRHRKCDELRPICQECRARQLQCHGYGDRPTWLNDERQVQAEMSRIKRAVKFNVAHSRQSRGKKQTDLKNDSQSDHNTFSGTSEPLACQSQIPNWSFRNSQLLAYYLDHIFQLQFPFYNNCSSRSTTGKGWLLWIAMRSKPMCQAMLTLAALHQSLSSSSPGGATQLDTIEYHMSALRALRTVLDDRISEPTSHSQERLVEFLGSGLFLISFEVRSLVAILSMSSALTS